MALANDIRDATVTYMLSTTATIALPMVRALGTLGENIEDYTGGFQQVLLELADALPDEAFLAKHLDE